MALESGKLAEPGHINGVGDFLIGGTLVMEGTGQEVHKGYIYFAMAFAVVLETLNMRLRSKLMDRVQLRHFYR